MPARGSPRLGAVARDSRRTAAPFHSQRLGSVRVSPHHRAHSREPVGDVAGHGGRGRWECGSRMERDGLSSPTRRILERVDAEGLAPVRFVDDAGDVTERYPFNPNGSANGIAALCSPDGRHLAIMPHPERGFLSWQCGWNPPEWRDAIRAAADRKASPIPSPWLRMFQNAREWCEGA